MVVGNGALGWSEITANEPATWNKRTCRLKPRHLEMGMGWIQSSFFGFPEREERFICGKKLIHDLSDKLLGLGYGLDIPLFLYF